MTADEIRRHGYRTLADLLRALHGFHLTYDRNYTYVGVRGFGLPGDYNTRILLLVDGVRCNDNIYDEALVAREGLLDADIVQQVEISRGPGASIYGNSAFFAVINVITKRGRDLGGLSASAAAGSFGTYEAKATYGQRLTSGPEFAVSGAFLDSAGQSLYFPEFSSIQDGVFEGGDGERSAKAFASLAVRGFTFATAYSSRRKNIPTASYGTVFGDTRALTRDDMLLISAGYATTLAERLALTARVTAGAYDYEGAYPYERSPSTTVINEDMASGRWWGAELTGSLRAKAHTLLAGIEHRRSLRQLQRNQDLGSPQSGFETRGDDDDDRLGFYAQDDVKIGERLLLSLGSRFDHYQDLGSRFNPRLALIVLPDPATTLKVLYGRAFRAPNEYEKHYYSGGGNGDRDLEAETIETVELSAERSLGAQLRLGVSVYGSDIRQLITLDVDDDGQLYFHNTDRLDSHGLELTLAFRHKAGADGRLNYSLQRTSNPSGAPVTNSPRHMLKASVSLPLAGQRLWLSADAQQYSRRLTPAGSETRGFAVVDVALLADRLPGGFEARCNLFNLFGTAYSDPASAEHVQASIAQDGRHFRVQLTRRF